MLFVPTKQYSHNERLEMLDVKPNIIFLLIIFCNACWFKCPTWWCHFMIYFVRFLLINNKLYCLSVVSTSNGNKFPIWLNLKYVSSSSFDFCFYDTIVMEEFNISALSRVTLGCKQGNVGNSWSLQFTCNINGK
jgi:hypothetical protein